jgi:predicted Zn-dependent protease
MAESQQSGTSIEALFTSIVQLELARLGGDLATVRRDRDVVVARLERLPEAHPIRSHGLAIILSTAAKIDIEDGQPEEAGERLAEAYRLAVDSKDMPIVAAVGVALAMLAAHLDRPAEAAEILGAAAQLRGADDFTQLDITALDADLGGLVDGPHAASYLAGKSKTRDDALARVDPRSLT